MNRAWRWLIIVALGVGLLEVILVLARVLLH
jgi:hypothetical protein